MKIIYCDGSTRGGKNKKGAENIGGFGVVVFIDEDENCVLDSFSRQYSDTTNNRMELEALIFALEYADKNYPDEEIIIKSDSAYVVNMWNSWIESWAKNGWKNSKKKEVENKDLVLEIYKHWMQPFYHCSVEKTDGHCGIVGNELADALATDNLDKYNNICDEYNISFA